MGDRPLDSVYRRWCHLGYWSTRIGRQLAEELYGFHLDDDGCEGVDRDRSRRRVPFEFSFEFGSCE